MRRQIDTAPRSGENVRLEDVAGAVESVHGSSAAGKWVSVDDVPTHWYPATEDADPEDEPSGRAVVAAVTLIPVIFVGAALLGLFGPFIGRGAQDATRIDRESVFSLDRGVEIGTDSQAGLQRETTEAVVLAPSGIGRQQLVEDPNRIEELAGELAGVRKELDVAVQRTQAAERAAEQLRQSLQQEQARSAALLNELAETRRDIDTSNEKSRNAEDAAAQQRWAAAQEVADLQQSLRQALDRSAVLEKQVDAAQAATATAVQQRHETQSRAAALASELAGIPRGLPGAEEQSEAASREIAELRQSLQDERRKNADLAAEAKAAQTATANAEQQRRAFEEAQSQAAALVRELAEKRREIETRNAQLREAEVAIAQHKQAANQETSELRRALQQKRRGIKAAQGDRTSAWSITDESLPVDQPVDQTDEGPTSTQKVEATGAEPPTSPTANEAELRLIPRAKALLDQGNIGAARIVLELAAEKDIAEASFMLAETYDPAVLSAWGTYGTRGELAKARELYAKAERGGISAAKERLDALHR